MFLDHLIARVHVRVRRRCQGEPGESSAPIGPAGRTFGERSCRRPLVRDPARPAELARYIARKGSVAVQGVSLTGNRVEGERCEVNLIPRTLEATNLGGLREGAQVNVEVDLVARYLERLLTGSS